jgi:hypothetical protein
VAVRDVSRIALYLGLVGVPVCGIGCQECTTTVFPSIFSDAGFFTITQSVFFTEEAEGWDGGQPPVPPLVQTFFVVTPAFGPSLLTPDGGPTLFLLVTPATNCVDSSCSTEAPSVVVTTLAPVAPGSFRLADLGAEACDGVVLQVTPDARFCGPIAGSLLVHGITLPCTDEASQGCASLDAEVTFVAVQGNGPTVAGEAAFNFSQQKQTNCSPWSLTGGG